ncbi:MAG: hypothetical protein L0H64_19860 [Pseudonocardia sp.]|nr:hypothetical protein [Pseudonocardia sp.]
MQLAVPPPEVLLPLGAGAAVLVVALIVILLVRRARRRRAAAAAGPSPTGTDAVREPDPAASRDRWDAPAERVGSGRTVATAVAQALAAREAHAGPADTRADARDRLLAVLLDDPVRAVGAVVELEDCRRQLDRLTDAVRHERATLADVLRRLSSVGLESDQLARLAGLSAAELRLLMQETAEAR